ncbi:MAG: hypothetical protein JNG83_11780 [Opitutaceae bacterium]|nr:hypothetical protein [Opitutaceae bacterium]
MKRFRYALDPLCLAACGLYAAGRWGLQPRVAGGFWHHPFTDLLLIPAGLPLVLWLQRRLGLRPHDRPPHWAEVGLHLIVWTVAAEVLAPRLAGSAVGDWRDALAYAAGALVAGGWWALA